MLSPSEPLDRPIWSALTSRQAHLAQGDHLALRYERNHAVFAACRSDAGDALQSLAALIPAQGPLVLLQAGPPPTIPGVTAQSSPLLQMIAKTLAPAPPPAFNILPLTEVDAPKMLALATLTEPGPYFSRTHALGNFFGVFVAGELVAMTGERMKFTGQTEISAVCTDPDHRGQGYAAGLVRHVTQRLLDRGETAFLHVFPHNQSAVSVYRALGFTVRREMTVTILTAGNR